MLAEDGPVGYRRIRRYLTDFDDCVGWDIQPVCRFADRLRILCFVQAVRFLFVSTQKREQPMHTDIGVYRLDCGSSL